MATLAEKKALLKANKNLLPNVKSSQITNGTEKQIDAFIAELESVPEYVAPTTKVEETKEIISTETPTVENNNEKNAILLTTIEGSYIEKNSKGVEVVLIKLPFIGLSTGAQFKFQWKDSFVLYRSTALEVFHLHQPLSIGQEFIFRAESLKYNPAINCFNGAIGYDWEPNIQKVLDYAKESKAYANATLAMYINSGLSKKDALDELKKEIVASQKELLKRPKLTF